MKNQVHHLHGNGTQEWFINQNQSSLRRNVVEDQAAGQLQVVGQPLLACRQRGAEA
jgi:hypothetical protein